MMLKKKLRGQEEIMGFALIVGIVFIILLVFLAIWLRKPSESSLESYKVQSFIDSMLEYTSECQGFVKSYLSVEDLIYECYDEEECLDGRDSCDVLGTTVEGILRESWLITENTEYRGYVFNITANGNDIVSYAFGNKTRNYLGDVERLPPKRGNEVEVSLIVYTE